MKITIYNDRKNNQTAPKKGYVRMNGEFIRTTSRTGKGSGGHDIYEFDVAPGDTFDARACENIHGRKTRWDLRMQWANFVVEDGGVRATDFDGKTIDLPSYIKIETPVTSTSDEL